MKFTQYLNHRFQGLVIKSSDPRKEFSLLIDGEQLAINSILFIVRTFFRIFLIPKVLADYAFVCLGLKRKPMPEVDMARAQAAMGQYESKKKKAKKVGFQTPNAPEIPDGLQ